MISLTLIFHIAAAIAFLVIIAWIVRLNQERRYFQKIWSASRSHSDKVWILDWPYAFLKRFCHMIGCELIGKPSQTQPCRILPKVWIEVDRLYQVIRVEVDPSQCLRVFTARNLDTMTKESLQIELSASFDRQYKVEFVSIAPDKPQPLG